MYRAPVPCPAGYNLYVDDGSEGNMSSCIGVYVYAGPGDVVPRPPVRCLSGPETPL